MQINCDADLADESHFTFVRGVVEVSSFHSLPFFRDVSEKVNVEEEKKREGVAGFVCLTGD